MSWSKTPVLGTSTSSMTDIQNTYRRVSKRLITAQNDLKVLESDIRAIGRDWTLAGKEVNEMRGDILDRATVVADTARLGC